MSTPPYLFGDLLALARLDWIRQMADGIAERGYPDFRRSDAMAMRVLQHRSKSISELASIFDISRQAARKLVNTLKERGYVAEARALDDSRRIDVSLTDSGEAYGDAVIEVLDRLNREIVEMIPPQLLSAADVALRTSIRGEKIKKRADRIAPPPH